MSMNDMLADASEIYGYTDGYTKSVVLIDPSNTERDIMVMSTDIAQTFDPETGMPVIGRTASVSLLIQHVLSLFGDYPKAAPNHNETPWRVRYINTFLEDVTFKIYRTAPDREMGRLTCFLEVIE